ncbi:helix-turn-helix transcriptional regulator [Bartonella sp. TP]|uniref:helix-turn-helix domain-containing protein n=1 Tax=Bartonella sp. TP TaxID=3057550 RepID=UPI0025B1AC20|nr:helix-turn-helix transcriptional regulator [Bartonella sp. TP]WJW79982.1 helix-turn-helix transcriptional regulator [Bartonella sp. TP]
MTYKFQYCNIDGMNKLQHYIKTQCMSQSKLATAIGLKQSAISKYIRGERFPSRNIILKIEKATDGYVRPSDWYVDNTEQPSKDDIVAQKGERKVNDD